MQDSQGDPMAGYSEGKPLVNPDRDAGQLRTMLQSGTGDGSFGRSSTVTLTAAVGGGSPIIVGGRYHGSYYLGYGYPGLWYHGYRGGFQTSVPVIPVSVPVGYGSNPAPQQPAAPPPEPTPEERAWGLLVRGDTARAVAAFEEIVNEDRERFEMVRVLAFALLVDGRFDEGAATMRLAYISDPGLAAIPLDEADAALGAAELRRLLRKVVRFAHDRDSASTWLTVAVLMQAEGRDEPAARMIERAGARSLEPGLVSEFDRALGSGGRSAAARRP